MTVNELLELIPPTVFSDLAAETNVDHQVKKLDGETVFKLILFSMLSSDKLSLRVMESYLHSARFRHLVDRDGLDSRFNSIRDRICTINAEYFEGIYREVFSTFNRELGEQAGLSKTDSTYVGIASSLLKDGIRNGHDEGNAFVKYSVNLKGSLPSSVQVFTKQPYVSEDLALSELIREDRGLVDNVVVYDRGLQSRAEFEGFTQDRKWFVTRGNPKTRLRDGVPREVPAKAKGSTVTILEDQTGLLMSKKGETANRYRLIRATIDESGEPICFVSNMLEADAYQIASWYRQRWEIELFFKFIKQHLNVKHLVSRTENGIKVMIYMTMILAILVIAYKKLNKIKSIKIAKIRFEIELDNEMVRQIVVLCGGDPEKAAHLWKSG